MEIIYIENFVDYHIDEIIQAIVELGGACIE